MSGPQLGKEKEWRASMLKWRQECMAELKPNGQIFQQIPWAQTAYVQPLVMPFDRAFFNETLGDYTPESWLASLPGGADSALLWTTYPNLGIDDRSQFDLIEAMPGGLTRLRTLVQQLHDLNVSVLWPYSYWDQGTRGGSGGDYRAAAAHDARVLSAFLASTKSDGMFTDGTLQNQMPFNEGNASTWMLSEFVEATARAGHVQAIAAEAGGRPDALNLTVMAIGEREWYPHVPAIDTMKWLEPRWMTLLSDRWSRDKRAQVQMAFFNGIGLENWQNVWGIWNGFVDRDRESLNRAATMLRFFGQLGFLQSGAWVPHTPAVLQQRNGVFGSEWPLENETLWTLVNRNDTSVAGPQLRVANDSRTFYDCYRGTILSPKGGALEFVMEGSGYGCIYASSSPPTADYRIFASRMQALTSGRPLSSFSSLWEPLQQTMAPVPRTTVPLSPKLSANMVSIPATTDWLFEVSGQEIEGVQADGTQGPWNDGGRDSKAAGDFRGVDVQFPFEKVPTPYHSQRLNISAFLIDRTPVTCDQYLNYLDSSNYSPKDAHNYLRSWSVEKQDDGSTENSSAVSWMYPAGWAKKPVTFVSLEEARAYCHFYGKRLPTTWEWQLAGQGTNSSRVYPWGDDAGRANGSACPALVDYSNVLPAPADVDAHPSGASPYGVLDLVGNVWQYTSSFSDEHTRAVLLRGGSSYFPVVPDEWYPCGKPSPGIGSGCRRNWYFPNGMQMRTLKTHAKYFLFSASFERAGTLGFRCASDSATAPKIDDDTIDRL
jgi:formylglycine-generating enzyme required for sulfatase activity